LDGTGIELTADDSYYHDNKKVLTSGSISDIINKIKETIDEI
jgi:hypothetical protein